mmetsp:Transcript_42088/g.132621  ORF Transcript_42088/g.132621 Transcript_42088/m.132621 type:complete len:488 (-) Transcript_42088:82-1545(-)
MLQQTRRRVCLLTLHTILFLLPSSSRAFCASLWAAGRCKRISSASRRLGPLPLSSRAIISMQSPPGSSSLELVDRLRGAASLHEFMREVKAASSPLLSSSSSSSCTSQKLLLCMGNEAADLDSIVCAVAFALLCQVGLVESLAPLRSSLCLPVLNIPQQDFALRQDAELLFRELRVSPALLSFMPDLSEEMLRQLLREGRLNVVLVDHNELKQEQKWLEPAVVGVIDHHEDTGAHADVRLRMVEPIVGSCSSLVASFLTGREGEMKEEVKQSLFRMLSAPILLDTNNFLGKVSHKDVEAGKLVGIHKDGEVTGEAKDFFDRLIKSRTDVTALNSSQKLRKDYKQWQLASLPYGIATVPSSLQEWLDADPKLEEAIEEAAEKEKLTLLAVMLTYVDQENQFSRQLLLFSHNKRLRDDCAHFLCSSSFPSFSQVKVDPHLGLDAEKLKQGTPSWKGSERLLAFAQANVKASRKQLQPAIEEFLKSYQEP